MLAAARAQSRFVSPTGRCVSVATDAERARAGRGGESSLERGGERLRAPARRFVRAGEGRAVRLHPCSSRRSSRVRRARTRRRSARWRAATRSRCVSSRARAITFTDRGCCRARRLAGWSRGTPIGARRNAARLVVASPARNLEDHCTLHAASVHPSSAMPSRARRRDARATRGAARRIASPLGGDDRQVRWSFSARWMIALRGRIAERGVDERLAQGARSRCRWSRASDAHAFLHCRPALASMRHLLQFVCSPPSSSCNRRAIVRTRAPLSTRGQFAARAERVAAAGRSSQRAGQVTAKAARRCPRWALLRRAHGLTSPAMAGESACPTCLRVRDDVRCLCSAWAPGRYGCEFARSPRRQQQRRTLREQALPA